MTPSVEQLWDIEQIKQLKVRCFRYLDTKDWEPFETLFTPDCVHNPPQESARVAISNEEYLADLKSLLGGVTTHHGHMPKITLLSDTEAEGISAMFDYVQTELPAVLCAFRVTSTTSRHTEKAQTEPDGKWRISSKQNVRVRLDHLAGPEDAVR